MTNPIEEYNSALLELSEAVSRVAKESAEAMGRIVGSLRAIEEICTDIRAIESGDIEQSIAVKHNIKNK